MKEINKFCSPVNDKSKHCLSVKALKKIIKTWNLVHTSSKSIKVENENCCILYKVINEKMKAICGNNKHWLWFGILEHFIEEKEVKGYMKIKRQLKELAKKELKPEKPQEWYKNPKSWLSNYDIKNVMQQYEQCKKYKYRFIGVFPIDFSETSNNGVCLYSEFCNIDINAYIKKGIKFIGLITNLDRHNESGSHWTSSFFVIDPKLQTYGAYYYDSTGNGLPNDLINFFNSIKDQCNYKYHDKSFPILINKKQHQYKGTECGVFSMLFQIRWLNKHIVKNNNTSFEEIVGANPNIDDENMLKLRDSLFRPNTKMELKKLKYFSSKK